MSIKNTKEKNIYLYAKSVILKIEKKRSWKKCSLQSFENITEILKNIFYIITIEADISYF